MEQAHHDVGAMIQISRDQCRQAALTVCGAAHDAADAHELLDALGLRAVLTSITLPA